MGPFDSIGKGGKEELLWANYINYNVQYFAFIFRFSVDNHGRTILKNSIYPE